ncbi:hypothetical protein DFH94DRAFT_682571 [Russula ochroleuca]|uniref:Chromatin modification-related protein n=1 Tax=Russula ochroleuca TaxID=152965 RepID=A0A9P5MUE0_9AGAM|nr:hypothetical protein DFH94DRAFT_682571 [Russula ochroleuca]
MPRSIKRKRAPRVQTEIPDEEDVDVVSVPGSDGEPELDTEEPECQEQNGDANHRFEVEGDIWDSFREEFHEAVEQLPLYLHRSYALLRELDEQVTGHYNQIHPTLQKYILLRRSLAGQRDPNAVKEQSPPPESEVNPVGDATEDSKPSLRSLETSTAPGDTRELLRHLGWLMEEVVRGSQEKVGLAQAVYDSVDRHIRLLDQSIREQEMSLSFGLRQGTHPSLLPDLAAPSRWARATRVTHSPIPGLSEDEDLTVPGVIISAGSEVTIGMATGNGNEGPARGSSAPKKSKKGKKRRTEKAVSEAAEAVPTPATITTSSTRSLRLKVPPLSAVVQGDAAADPNEPKYCYCNRVSFGNMVACDYPQCKREWFHLDCVGLTELPQSRTWYCRDCEPLVRKGETSGPRKRGR